MIELDEFVSALQAIEVIFFIWAIFFFFGARVYIIANYQTFGFERDSDITLNKWT